MVNSKETLEKLQGDLEKDLLEEVKSLLQKVGITIPRELTLDKGLRLLSDHYFKDVFKYDYGDSADVCSPPDALGGIRPLTTLCGISDVQQVETYIDTVIIGPGNLPDWLKAPAKDDLLQISRDLVATPTGLKWNWDKYEKAFVVSQGDERTLKLDAVYVYANVPLTQEADSAIFSVIYYMGVFYETVTELKILRGSLQKDAYASAKDMTKNPKNILTTPQLKDALRKYAITEFRQVFGFSHTDSSPPEFEGGAAATFVHNDALKYIQDDVNDNSKLKNFIDEDYFGGVDVRDEGVKDQIKQTILKMLAPRPGTWHSNTSMATYASSNTSLNPVKAYFVTCYFVKESTTAKDEKASVIYIYILGLFYEVLRTVEVVQKDLYKLVCHKLDSDIKQGDPWKLKDALFKSASQLFELQYRTPWDGKKTLIDDPDVMNIRIPYSVVFDFEDYPLTEAAIIKRISLGAFRKDGYEFPWDKDLQGRVFGDLVDTITALSKEFLDGQNLNVWQVKQQQPSLRIHVSNPNSPTLKQYSTFLYTLCQKAERQTIVKRFIVYYLTVFYALPYNQPPGP